MSNSPLPTALKLLRGTTRKDRTNPREPKPATLSANARPPAFLGLSPTARRAWRALLAVLGPMHVATVADRIALGMLADALAEYASARDTVRRDGPTYSTTNENGGTMVRPHPEVAIASDAWRRARALLADFGLTPATRSRVSAAAPGEVDPLAEWMAR